MAWKKLSSGVQESSALIYNGPCFYFGFTSINAKSSFTITVYDALTATGIAVENYKTDVNKEMEGHSHAHPVTCRNGLYLALGGGSAIVYYTPLREGVQ